MNPMLTALAGHRGFVVYRLAPLANGKTDKIPIDPLTGYNSNAQDATTWLTPAMAEAFAADWAATYRDGTGVGIVIYQGSQLFCIDIDGCVNNGQVNGFAFGVVARFPGAVVEVSASGTGLHIFGMYRGVLPPHKTKNTHWHVESYSEARFIALTGNFLKGHEGFIGTDCTDALIAFNSEYMPKTGEDYNGEWTTEPQAGYDPWFNDDANLLNFAMHYHTPGQRFGSVCPFVPLWTGDEDTLGKFFPPNTPGQAYDASSADQALANLLAYHTGNNCQRVFDLMHSDGCALKREKWDRTEYIQGTIAKACAGEKPNPVRPRALPPASSVAPPVPVEAPKQPQDVGVPQAGPAPVAVGNWQAGPPQAPQMAQEPSIVPPAPTTPPVQAAPRGVGAMLFTRDQQEVFAGFVYVSDVHMVMAPNGLTFDKQRFDLLPQFAGREYQMTIDGQGSTTSAWEAFTESKVVAFPKVRGLYFEPRKACGEIMEIEGLPYVNSYIPLNIRSVPGDVTPFLDHIKRLLPEGNDAHILLSFLKFMVQHKGVKAAWCPFIQGVEGNGKSWINFTMQYCLGERYTHFPKASELDGRFNSAFYGKLFIPVNDVKITDDHGSMWETLKPMIDGTKMEIEAKGVDKVTREVCFNFILNSNHQDGIRKTNNDRRIAPFFCAQQNKTDLVRDGLTNDYFVNLWAWSKADGWAHVLHWLSTDPIDPAYNPAGACVRAPETTATGKAIAAGLGSVEQDILEAVAIGLPGFAGGWISSSAMDAMIDKGRSRLSRNKRRELLLNLGYVPHPALLDGRASVVHTDGTRPRLYLKAEHPLLKLTDGRLISQLYQEAQAPK